MYPNYTTTFRAAAIFSLVGYSKGIFTPATMISDESDTQPKQLIDPAIIPRLDPEYLAFHNAHLVHLIPPHTVAWDPSVREAPAVPGSSEPLKVGKVADYNLPNANFRAFTPEGQPPVGGWPLFVFFHGGGWTFGNITSETAFSTNMCVRANCVVASVNYRLGPEIPYPAAVEDAIDSLRWVIQNGRQELGINFDKIAVGGSSSGGNLAAILALKVAELSLPVSLIFQLLVVPVTDNTATVETSSSWKENELTPWLSPGRMLWFRHNYLPNEEDWTKWDASPIFAPPNFMAQAPKAWIAVNEVDILRDEGLQYGQKLKSAGVEVEVEVYKGAPHPIMAMDGALQIGKKLVSDAAAALNKALHN